MKYVLYFLFLLISQVGLAQDLIVTKTNDSLNCKVVSQQGAFTLYKVLTTGGPQSRAISNKDIVKVEYNYFTSNVKNDASKITFVAVSNSPNETSFNFGSSYTRLLDLVDNNNPDFDSYFKDLANGYSVYAEIQQSLKKRVGLSIRYDFFRSEAMKDNYPIKNNLQTNYFDYNDVVRIHTISPGLYYKYPIIKDKQNIRFLASYDFNLFENASKMNYDSRDLLGNKSGFSIGAAYEYFLNNDIGIVLQLKYRYSKLNKVTMVNSTGSSSTYELYGFDKININRISAGINICFK